MGGIERVHFDFKEKASATSLGLGDPDKQNLAKAVSGFANGAGGVLVWGLEDGSIMPKPISHVSQFVGSMLQVSHQVTTPAVLGIDGDFIPADGSPDSGFGLTLVPESDLPPHRVVLSISKVQNHYYVRSGSSFSVATHSQLEDMFGRRPRPRLFLRHEFEVGIRGHETELSLTLALQNMGRGIARFPFLALKVTPPHGLSRYGLDGNGHFGLPCIETGDRVGEVGDRLCTSSKFGSQDGYVIHSGMTHPVTKIKAKVLDRSSTPALRIKYSLAAEGIPLQEEELLFSADDLLKAVEG